MTLLYASGGQSIWSFSFSISPSKEYSQLISFRTDWFDLFAVQQTLNSHLQHHNLKASVQLALSLPYGPTLTSCTYKWKNYSLDYTRLCKQNDVFAFENAKFAIVLFSRSKCLLIWWMQSLSAVILESKKIKSHTLSIVSSSICHEMIGSDAMILVFWIWVLRW